MKNKFLLAVLLLSFCIPINSLQAQTNNNAFKKILGRWIRSDAGYVLVINNIDEEGKLQAEYLNPRPVNVSQARAEMDAEKIKVFIELRDKYYPGSYYKLTYDEESDRFTGTYHHLGINQQFEVVFVRQEK